MLRDCIVHGLRDASVRRKMLAKTELSLWEAEEAAHSAEMVAANVDRMASAQNIDNVHAKMMKSKGQPPGFRHSESRRAVKTGDTKGRARAAAKVVTERENLHKTTLQLTCFLGPLPANGQLNVSVKYGRTTLEATLVALRCSEPDLCGWDVIKALEQLDRQVLAVGIKAAPGKPSSIRDELELQQLLGELQDLFSEEFPVNTAIHGGATALDFTILTTRPNDATSHAL
ncbi:hypothetical protein HPB50_015048 [Hyalomma asiaticum]|uniref:Uncharacterized protein n=1 Tax=Hyalomma asiaticum TaxID=266040 RepID=A0ACB7SY14_HYAAI|nr:hypothetical protein HPB50_015048 [Hyalomma asiaticum]